MKSELTYENFLTRKCSWKHCLKNAAICSGLNVLISVVISCTTQLKWKPENIFFYIYFFANALFFKCISFVIVILFKMHRHVHLWLIAAVCDVVCMYYLFYCLIHLTHWGRVTHICISKLTIIGLDNGLLPGWCQAIIWTNARILLIGPIPRNFNEILIKIHTFSFRPQCVKNMDATLPMAFW